MTNTVTTATTTATTTSVADTSRAMGPRLIMAIRTKATIMRTETGVLIATVKIIPRLRTSTTTANGWDTKAAPTTCGSTSITRGNMAISKAVSVVHTGGAW